MYTEFTVKTDPTINPAHSAAVEAAIGSELYSTNDEYQQIDPIGGSSPSGRLSHDEMLGDD